MIVVVQAHGIKFGFAPHVKDESIKAQNPVKNFVHLVTLFLTARLFLSRRRALLCLKAERTLVWTPARSPAPNFDAVGYTRTYSTHGLTFSVVILNT